MSFEPGKPQSSALGSMFEDELLVTISSMKTLWWYVTRPMLSPSLEWGHTISKIRAELNNSERGVSEKDELLPVRVKHLGECD